MDFSLVIFVINQAMLCMRFFSSSFEGINVTGALAPKSHGPWWKCLLICVRYTLTNSSCSGESSWTYCIFFFFWAVGLLKDICSMAEEYCGPKGCCGIWDLVCLTQVTWLTSVTKDRIWFDLIWFDDPSSVFLYKNIAHVCVLISIWALAIIFVKTSFLVYKIHQQKPQEPLERLDRNKQPLCEQGLVPECKSTSYQPA